MKKQTRKTTGKPELDKDFLSQFKTQHDLNDYFSQMYKQALEQLLQGEMDNHLGFEKNQRTENEKMNFRNGSSEKTIKSDFGEIPIEVPRDRNSSFEPALIKKRDTVAENIEEVVLSLYGKGMTTRDIETQIQEIYGVELSDSSVSRITDRILDLVAQWQARALDSLYPIVWMDGIHFKVRHNHRIVSKVAYIAIGLNMQGKKEVMGIWIDHTENAAFWMKVLDEFKERGVKDILITATDNLKGFTAAIQAVFPKTLTQVCVTHQIRNSLLYVAHKNKREFARDLKLVYTAPTKEAAEQALEQLEDKWNKKYGRIIQSWKTNWERLSVFFEFPAEIRKIMYTTNVIENFNRMIRKYTKNRLIFPNDDAVMKAVFLTVQQVQGKWYTPIGNWEMILLQFYHLYPDRIKLHL